jgi:hypothetical protein
MIDKQYVVLATPCLSGRVTVDYMQSLLATVALLGQHGYTVECRAQVGDCFVDKARNALVRHFMRGRGENLVFLDDDLGWPAEGVLRILQAQHPVVSGAYPLKWNKGGFPVILKEGAPIGPDGLIPADVVPGGFLRVQRWVFDAIQEAWPDAWYRNPDIGADASDVFYEYFASGRCSSDPHEFLGEDFFFSRRLSALGIVPRVEPDIDFIHTDHRYKFHGNFARALESVPAVSSVSEVA